MKKILSLLSVLTISGTAMPNVIAGSSYKKDNVRVKRQKPKKYKSIYELIKNKDLGELRDNYEDTILHAIVRLNPDISVDDIRIVRIPNNNMALIAHSYSTNNVNICDDVAWVYFSISPQGMIGNSMFYNILTNDVNLQPNKNKIQRPKEAPPAPPTIKKEPIYATDLPKSQRNIQSNVAPPKPPRNLNNLFLNTNLDELTDNLPETILNRFIELNINSINRNQISISNITTTSAIIIPNQNSRYIGNLEVFFTLNYKDKQNLSKISDNEKDNDSNSNNNQNIKDIINKFNNLSKKSKQNKLNESNQHYQNLSENNKKVFKDKLRNIGLEVTSAGISGAGILGISKMTGISPIKGLSTTANYIKNSLSSTNIAVSTGTGEAMEMTPLLSESTVAEGLTAFETLSVTERAIIGAEAGTAAALAPETLGLSLVIGGLVIAGTALIWWFNDTNGDVIKHESHNQYNEIEKYYKFLSHDQLKLSISSAEWNKIKEIYEKTKNKEMFSKHITNFIKECKKEITNFHKEDHSGWGGSIIDDDINIILEVIYFEFETINNHFSSNPNHGWKIVTNTISSYFIIEEE